jgi:hypothetical protein
METQSHTPTKYDDEELARVLVKRFPAIDSVLLAEPTPAVTPTSGATST